MGSISASSFLSNRINLVEIGQPKLGKSNRFQCDDEERNKNDCPENRFNCQWDISFDICIWFTIYLCKIRKHWNLRNTCIRRKFNCNQQFKLCKGCCWKWFWAHRSNPCFRWFLARRKRIFLFTPRVPFVLNDFIWIKTFMIRYWIAAVISELFC